MQKYYTDKNGLILLLRDLGCKDDEIRYRAYSEAQSLPDDQLLELTNAEIEQYRRYTKRGAVVVLGSLIGMIMMQVVAFILEHYSIGPDYLFPSIFAFAAVWFFAFSFGLYPPIPPRRLGRSRRTMSLLIKNREDARFTGAALLMWTRSLTEAGSGVSSALQQLLPKLRAGDVQGWTKEQKAALLKPLQLWHMPLLSWYKDTDLTLCVLKALEQGGDVSAIEPVQKLADMAVGGNEEEKTKKVKQAAAECLEALLARVAPDGQKQTLLRAVETVATPETLLRPVGTKIEETPPEQLLRPKE